MRQRPAHLPNLHPRFMSDDGQAYIGSALHNDLMGWLFLTMRTIETSTQASWQVANLLDIDIPWDSGRVDRLRADLMLYPTRIDPRLEVLNLGTAPAPLLVLEIADVGEAREMAADVDLTTTLPDWYAAIGVQEYLVFDLTSATQGHCSSSIWARRLRRGAKVSDWWQSWEPDEYGRWVSTTTGLAFRPTGSGMDVSLRVWNAEGTAYKTESEYYAYRRQQHEEERDAVTEAQLTLLRTRYDPDLS